jgi:DNA-binding ferritin-like protein
MSLFPENMMTANADMSLEGVASKLTYFQVQLHLQHWQTMSYAEHKAIDTLYDFVVSFTDEVVEKLMGYAGRRVKTFTLQPLSTESSVVTVTEVINFAYALEKWSETNRYCDIENLAQSLSGEAAKTKYLLTLK